MLHELTLWNNVLQLGTHKMDFYQKHNGVWYGIRQGNLANIWSPRIFYCYCLFVVVGGGGRGVDGVGGVGGGGFYLSVVTISHIHVGFQCIRTYMNMNMNIHIHIQCYNIVQKRI